MDNDPLAGYRGHGELSNEELEARQIADGLIDRGVNKASLAAIWRGHTAERFLSGVATRHDAIDMGRVLLAEFKDAIDLFVDISLTKGLTHPDTVEVYADAKAASQWITIMNTMVQQGQEEERKLEDEQRAEQI